jgi:hypothetical protein
MTDTTVVTVPDMIELRREVVQSIDYFSKISKVKVKDNDFIQEKINQISKQRKEFQNFAESSVSHGLKMCNYARDLVGYFGNDNYNVLLKLLRPSLSDIEKCKLDASSLKEQLDGIKDSLCKIAKEISEYEEYEAKITEERGSLPDKIDKVTESALSYANGRIITALIGTTAVAVAPFTSGASLGVAGAIIAHAFLRG